MNQEPIGNGFYTKFDGKTTSQFHKDRMTNKTGFIGVTFVKPKGKSAIFRAYIRIHGRKNKLYCGSGKTAEEAARKYDAKAREIYGPSAVVNFED